MNLKSYTIVGDESVDFPVLKALQDLGYSVFAIAVESSGVSDLVVMKIAEEREAVIITCDKDFGTLVVGNRLHCAGLILLRLHPMSAAEMADRVRQAFSEYGDKFLGSLTVIQDGQVRVRPLPPRAV